MGEQVCLCTGNLLFGAMRCSRDQPARLLPVLDLGLSLGGGATSCVSHCKAVGEPGLASSVNTHMWGALVTQMGPSLMTVCSRVHTLGVTPRRQETHHLIWIFWASLTGRNLTSHQNMASPLKFPLCFFCISWGNSHVGCFP